MAVDLICITCPRGCHLHVDDDLNVTGNSCPRGAVYGKQEVTDPRRTITTTVKTDSKEMPVCPVKTKDTVSKKAIFDVMKAVNESFIHVPVHIGDVVIANVAGTGVDLVATREILK